MASSYTTLNAGAGGDSVDMESVTYGSAPTTRKRTRTVITGSAELAIADVVATDPSSSAYGLPVRLAGPVVTNTIPAPSAYGLPVRRISSAATATKTVVTSSASSGVILAANANRKKFMIMNSSGDSSLWLRFAAEAASTTNYNIILNLPTGGAGAYHIFGSVYVEGDGGICYTGEIRGIWPDSPPPSGDAIITEWT
jgi:hypothetical protein